MVQSGFLKGRRHALGQAGALLASLSVPPFALAAEPVMIGLDAEFGLESSLSAQAVELGLRTALAQINANGGVLGGRPLELITKDHRSIPARGIKNLKDLAANPNLVAVFGARFSPVVIEELPTIKELKLPFMAVWSSADPIVDNGMQPNYVFRLSLRDSLAMPKMLVSAKQRGFNKIGLLLTNTAWGRSNLAAAEKYVANAPQGKIVQTAWYNWKDTTFQVQYDKLLAAGAEALLVVGNDDEIALFVREMAARPPAQRLPIFSHWGITGGEFAKQAGTALHEVDLTVIQTFSFYTADKTVLPQFMKYLGQVSGIRSIDEIRAPVGVAHAYDMAHILARAINLAGSSERSKIRDALEKVPEHRGLIKLYNPAFTPTRHEALGPDELLMVRFDKNGVLLPAQK